MTEQDEELDLTIDNIGAKADAKNGGSSNEVDLSVNWNSQQSLIANGSSDNGLNDTTILSSQKLKAKYIDMFQPYNDEEDLWTQVDRHLKRDSENPTEVRHTVKRDYFIPGNETILEPDPPQTEKEKQDKIIADAYWTRVANCNPDIGVPLLQTPQAVWNQFKDTREIPKSPKPPRFDNAKYNDASPDRSTQIQSSQEERQKTHDTDKWAEGTVPVKKRLTNEFTAEEIYAAKRIIPDCRMFKKCMKRKKK